MGKQFIAAICFALCFDLASPAMARIVNIPKEYPTIQGGIDAAMAGDTVLVEEGIYYERLNFRGKPITVASNYIFNGVYQTIVNTIINADTLVIGYSDSGSVVSFVSGEDFQSLVKGFTITNGIGTKEGDSYFGGGIYCFGSSPTIEYNIISENTAEYPGLPSFTNGRGGGIYFENCSPHARYNLITYNRALGKYDWIFNGEGGGVYLKNCLSGNIENNVISFNFSGGDGSGIYLRDSQPLIRGNRVTDNDTYGAEGSGIFCITSSPEIESNYVARNRAGGIICEFSSDAVISKNVITWNQSAGGIFVAESSPYIKNNTIYGNEYTFEEWGGGIIFGYDSGPTIVNNVVVGNTDVGIAGDNTSNAIINYNDVWDHAKGNYLDCEAGPRDISCDPDLVDPVIKEDFTLLATSPCIDAGDPDAEVPEGGGDRIDIGAFEYQQAYNGFLAFINNPLIGKTGQRVGWDYSINNPTEGPRKIDAWIEVSGPLCAIARKFLDITIPSGETSGSIDIVIPSWTPVDFYTVKGRLGLFGEEIWDSEVFDLEIIQGPRKSLDVD